MTCDVAQDQAFVKLKPGPDLVRGERERARARACSHTKPQTSSLPVSISRARGRPNASRRGGGRFVDGERMRVHIKVSRASIACMQERYSMRNDEAYTQAGAGVSAGACGSGSALEKSQNKVRGAESHNRLCTTSTVIGDSFAGVTSQAHGPRPS